MGLLAIASLVAVSDGQMNLYDPHDDALDHVQPNKPHADALRKLRAGLANDPHGMMRWWEGDYPCKMPWRGIRCEGGNGVTHIIMSNRGLSGHIDPAIGLIETLQVLDLGNNFIFHEIPGEAIANLTRLETLNLHNNKIRGKIPQSWVTQRRWCTSGYRGTCWQGRYQRSWERYRRWCRWTSR